MTQFNRRQMLLGGAAAAAAAIVPWQRRTARANGGVGTRKNLIVVLAQGGWDTSYAVDPKAPGGGVDVPAGTIVQHGNLDILEDPSRPAVGAFFTRYAALTAVVRGVRLASVSHPACTQAMLTGARNETSPDMAAVVAQTHGAGLPIPYLVLGNTAFAGPYASSMGRVGATNQIVGLLDPTSAYPVDGARPAFVPSSHDEAVMRAYTVARADRQRAVRGATGYNKRRIDDFTDSLPRGDRLRELRAGLGNLGTQLNLPGQRQLAIDAISTGISQSVMMSSQLMWDTHDDNLVQNTSHQNLFSNLTALLDALAATPGGSSGSTMLDETVVAVVSEMGRTPQLNNSTLGSGGGGKDHWPVTSAMVIGAGVAGGRAYGATTSNGEASLIDFASGTPSTSTTARTIEPKHFAAGVMSLCGVDPGDFLPDAEVFDAFVA